MTILANPGRKAGGVCYRIPATIPSNPPTPFLEERMRHIPCLLACLCVGIFAHLAPAEEPKIIEPTPEQLKEATETLAKAGVGYYPDGGLDPRLKVDRPPRYLGQ